MTPDKIAELETSATAAETAAKDAGGTDENLNTLAATARKAVDDAKAAPSQSPVKKELDRVKKPKTEAEKLAFSIKSTAKRAKELGLDPLALISEEDGGSGASDDDDDDIADDDRPVTMGDLKKMQRQDTVKTALSLADEIVDEDDRELVKHHITSTIKPSGNPQEDFKNALAIVSSVKNGQIVTEDRRRTPPKQHGSAAGAPPRQEDHSDLTADEKAFRGPPWNLSEKEIKAARPKAE